MYCQLTAHEYEGGRGGQKYYRTLWGDLVNFLVIKPKPSNPLLPPIDKRWPARKEAVWFK